MTISIITATIEPDSRLERTLQSVKMQSHADIEHIVVDSLDPIRSSRLQQAYPDVLWFRHKPSGVYDAINKGLEVATGDIIGILHSNDCLASPNVLAEVAKAFEEDGELDFVYSDIRYVSPDTRRHGRTYHADYFVSSHLAYGMAPPHPSLYIRREAMTATGKYSDKYPIVADFDLWVRLFNNKSLKHKYLPMTIVEMAKGGISTKLSRRLFHNNMEKLRVLKDNGMNSHPLKMGGKALMMLRDCVRDFLRNL